MYKTIAEKFDHLGVDNAPGQESQQKEVALDLRGEKLEGPAVDFSHGDVDAHTPTPGSFEVFAEGVEEAAQVEKLKEMGCELIQGYYFSKPVPAEEFNRFTVSAKEEKA